MVTDMVKRLVLLWIAVFAAQPLAAADWLRAETEHYVIHARLEGEQIRDLAQLVEDFDRVLNRVLPAQTRSGRKLVLYLEDNDRRISRISDWRNIGWVGSWPEFAGSFIVYDPDDDYLTRNHALFYALAGHHIDNGFIRPTPPWVRTGVQLFFATAFVSEEGDVILGAPDMQRPMEGSMDSAKLELLLAADAFPDTESAWKRFYGWSREAVFPMLIQPDNSGLLEAYLNAYGEGRSLEDARSELGDLDAWAKQVRERQTARRPTFRRVAIDQTTPAEATVRPLTEAEVELADMRFERLRADGVESAARRLSRLSEKHPESALVWFEYAAAEFARVRASQFGGEEVFRGFGFSNGEIVVTANPYSDAEAWRAVNRALELDPELAEARALKAEILMGRLVRAGDIGDTQAFDEVRDLLAPLAAEPEAQPLAAALMHQSYIEQGIDPPQDVIEGLGRAFVRNAGVEEFRYAYAVSLARHGRREVAERLLTSMLNHPRFRDAAQRALDNGS